MILLSRYTKTIFEVNHTVPWKDRLSNLKKANYQDLTDEVIVKGWYAASFSIQVGCHGFLATSVHHLFQKIGWSEFKGPKRGTKILMKN